MGQMISGQKRPLRAGKLYRFRFIVNSSLKNFKIQMIQFVNILDNPYFIKSKIVFIKFVISSYISIEGATSYYSQSLMRLL